jgi:hypothetical protein
MSDDRKPGRVRMVSGSGGRTVTEAPVAATAVVTAPAPAAVSAKPRGGMKAALLPGALFLIGCIGGGVAIARLMP